MAWLLVFLGASVLIALTPGANNLLGLHHGMTHGIRRGLAGLGGRLVAFTLLIGAVAAGLGQILAASETALTVIKWAGVAYLLFLGIRLLWSTLRQKGEVTLPDLPAESVSAVRIARKEFGVAITNPKAILIFTAFVPQFIDPAHGPFAGQIALLEADIQRRRANLIHLDSVLRLGDCRTDPVPRRTEYFARGEPPGLAPGRSQFQRTKWPMWRSPKKGFNESDRQVRRDS